MNQPDCRKDYERKQKKKIVRHCTCFVFHVNNDCKSADMFKVMLTCKKKHSVK